MCDDVLSCAKGVFDGDRQPFVYVAGPTELHAATRDACLTKTQRQQTAAAGYAVREQMNS